MKLLFVNHVHPDSGLVAGLRLWRFAQELARRRHQVLFISGGGPASPDATVVRSRLRSHDWQKPFLLDVRDDDSRFRRGPAESGPMTRLLNRTRTAATLACRGGVFWRWRRTAEEHFETIASCFGPELAFATFGNLDALWTARDYAAAYGVPWVMDVKDPMTRFVPRPLWGTVRRRCAGAAAVTVNAEVQRELSGPVLGRSSVVVYSGADVTAANAHRDVVSPDQRVVVLCGSLYDEANAMEFLAGYNAWLEDLPAALAGTLTLVYCGVDDERFRELASRIPGLAGRTHCLGQVPRETFLALCRRAVANAYVASDVTFHHKLFELLATGRPVLALPREHPESMRLAETLRARFHVCPDGGAVADALRSALDADLRPSDAIATAVGWPRFTDDLEGVFAEVLDARRQ